MTAAPTATVEELQAELAERDAKIASMARSADVSDMLFDTVEDVVAFYGHDALVNIALDKWAEQNRTLIQSNRTPQPEPKGAELEKRVQIEARELLEDRTRHMKKRGWLLRVVKMVKPNGQLIEVPLEGQINSYRLGVDLAMAPYREKGYKIATPYMCQSQGCNREAAVTQDGQHAFGGYCSPDHRDRTEPPGGDSNRVIRPL